MNDSPATPECDKLRGIQIEWRFAQEFIEHLNAKGIQLCMTTSQFAAYGRGDPAAGRYTSDAWMPITTPIGKLLCEFFEIDPDKLESERQDLHAWASRKRNTP